MQTFVSTVMVQTQELKNQLLLIHQTNQQLKILFHQSQQQNQQQQPVSYLKYSLVLLSPSEGL